MQVEQHVRPVQQAAEDGIEVILVVHLFFLGIEVAVEVALDEADALL